MGALGDARRFGCKQARRRRGGDGRAGQASARQLLRALRRLEGPVLQVPAGAHHAAREVHELAPVGGVLDQVPGLPARARPLQGQDEFHAL